MLISPSVLALGNVVSDVISTAVIRNTYRRDTQTINSIDNNAGAGISISGATPPATLQPLQDRVYTITVTTDGPPQIDGTIDWNTTYGTLTLTITGTRIIIFPYPPQKDVIENLQWVTDIIKAADGTEQRFSVRRNPRQSVSYEIVAEDVGEINNIRNLFGGWTARIFGLPLWWDERALIADVSIGDDFVRVRADGLDYPDFRVGGLAMIYQENLDGSVTQETLQVSSIGQTGASPISEEGVLRFVTTTTNSFDGELATLVPVLPAVLVEGASVQTPQAGDSALFSTRFDMLADSQSEIRAIEVDVYPELDDFDGRPTLIITDRNFSGSSLAEKFNQQVNRVDFTLGKFSQDSQELTSRIQAPFTWIAESVQTAYQIRQLLFHLKGKWRNVWLPTWRDDFIVNANIGVSSVSIDVDNQGFAKFLGDVNSPWSGLRIRLNDGQVSYHRITSAVEIDSTTDRINIDPATPFGSTVAPGDIEQVDLLLLVRGAQDEIQITHSWNDAETDELDETIETGFIGNVRAIT